MCLIQYLTKVREDLLPETLPPPWFWLLTALSAAFSIYRFTIIKLPQPLYYTADEMDEMIREIQQWDYARRQPPTITSDKAMIYDDNKDVYLIKEFTEKEGERWFVWTPVNRGAWKVFGIWWVSLLGIFMSVFFVVTLIVVQLSPLRLASEELIA